MSKQAEHTSTLIERLQDPEMYVDAIDDAIRAANAMINALPATGRKTAVHSLPLLSTRDDKIRALVRPLKAS